VGARTGGGLDRRPIGAEGLGLGALGGIGHGANFRVVRWWGLREHGGGEARQRVPREKRTVGSSNRGVNYLPAAQPGPARGGYGGRRDARHGVCTRAHERERGSALRRRPPGCHPCDPFVGRGNPCFFFRTHLASAFVYRNNTNAVNTDSRRCAETRARACGAGSARVERVCACAIDALAGVGVRCGRAV
jgi:hypothetical protein